MRECPKSRWDGEMKETRLWCDFPIVGTLYPRSLASAHPRYLVTLLILKGDKIDYGFNLGQCELGSSSWEKKLKFGSYKFILLVNISLIYCNLTRLG